MSVVGSGGPGNKIWRRERIVMTEPDSDDVAFLTGELMMVLAGWEIGMG